MYLRQRAVLRRAHWHKIELEYEQSLAEQMGFLDPFHYVDYNEWRTGKLFSQVIDLKRVKCL